MVDIQSPTAENRRGKKEDIKKEEDRRNNRAKYNGLPYYIGRPQLLLLLLRI